MSSHTCKQLVNGLYPEVLFGTLQLFYKALLCRQETLDLLKKLEPQRCQQREESDLKEYKVSLPEKAHPGMHERLLLEVQVYILFTCAVSELRPPSSAVASGKVLRRQRPESLC